MGREARVKRTEPKTKRVRPTGLDGKPLSESKIWTQQELQERLWFLIHNDGKKKETVKF